MAGADGDHDRSRAAPSAARSTGSNWRCAAGSAPARARASPRGRGRRSRAICFDVAARPGGEHPARTPRRRPSESSIAPSRSATLRLLRQGVEEAELLDVGLELADRLAFVDELLRSTASTPSSPLRFMSRNWLPSRMKAAAQVSIRSNACGGKPLFLIAAASAGRLSGGTRCSERRQIGRVESQARHRRHDLGRVLVVDDRLDHQLLRALRPPWSNFAVRH